MYVTQRADTLILQSNSNSEYKIVKSSETKEELSEDQKDKHLTESKELYNIENNEDRYITVCI